MKGSIATKQICSFSVFEYIILSRMEVYLWLLEHKNCNKPLNNSNESRTTVCLLISDNIMNYLNIMSINCRYVPLVITWLDFNLLVQECVFTVILGCEYFPVQSLGFNMMFPQLNASHAHFYSANIMYGVSDVLKWEFSGSCSQQDSLNILRVMYCMFTIYLPVSSSVYLVQEYTVYGLLQ